MDYLDKCGEADNNSAMGWLDFAEFFIRRVPFERLLTPRRDRTEEMRKLLTSLKGDESVTQDITSKESPATTQKPKEVAYSGSTGIVTRPGVDAERIAWQDSLIRGELWLLEGHLKNKCIGCGGDLECCFKHTQNVIDAARETQSMTTEPLYREVVALTERIQPLVLPDDIKAGKYITYYPPLSIDVSKLRTQFDKRVMGYARPPVTLEEAKRMAAEKAAEEVEKKWASQETT